MSERAFVKNAADPRQVKFARRKELQREADRQARLKAALQTAEGRGAMMDILEDCKVFESIWHPSALIHFNAGQQDVGHKLQARIVEVDEEAYELMEREARVRRRRLEREVDAVHTAAEDSQEGHDGRREG